MRGSAGEREDAVEVGAVGEDLRVEIRRSRRRQPSGSTPGSLRRPARSRTRASGAAAPRAPVRDPGMLDQHRARTRRRARPRRRRRSRRPSSSRRGRARAPRRRRSSMPGRRLAAVARAGQLRDDAVGMVEAVAPAVELDALGGAAARARASCTASSVVERSPCPWPRRAGWRRRRARSPRRAERAAPSRGARQRARRPRAGSGDSGRPVARVRRPGSLSTPSRSRKTAARLTGRLRATPTCPACGGERRDGRRAGARRRPGSDSTCGVAALGGGVDHDARRRRAARSCRPALPTMP